MNKQKVCSKRSKKVPTKKCPSKPKSKSKKYPVTMDGVVDALQKGFDSPELNDLFAIERLAVLVAADKATPEQEREFHDFVKQAVCLHIKRHIVCDTRYTFHDMFNDVYAHIKANLHSFKPVREDPKTGEVRKMCLNTWLWPVIFNAILRKRTYRARYRRDHILVNPNEPSIKDEENEDCSRAHHVYHGRVDQQSTQEHYHLSMDFREVMLSMLCKHKKYHTEIVALFGDPTQDGYRAPEEVDIKGAALRIGVSRNKLHLLFQKKFVPFLERRFGDSIF